MVKVRSVKLNQAKDTITTSARMLKVVWDIDKKLFIGAFIVSIIPGVIPFINIYIYKLIIDLVVGALNTGIFDIYRLIPLIVLRILTYFFQDASFGTQEYIERLLWTKVPIELNQIYFKKVSGLDVHYFESDQFHNLLERVKESYGFRPQQLITSLLYGTQSLIQLTIAFVTLARLNWLIIIIISLIAIPEFFSQTYQSKLSWGIWSEHSPFRKRYGYLTRLLEGPREIKEVKMFDLAPKFLEEVESIQQRFYQENQNIANKSLFLNILFSGLSTAVFIGIEIYVVFQALAKKVTIGDISFYTGVVMNYQNGLGGFLRNLNKVFESSLYVKSIFEILESEPIIKLPAKPVKLPDNKSPKIEFRKVDFSYPGSKNKVLKDFSLTINPGEKIAFVGENGAGKSTIIKLLARFYDVDKGDILINGISIKELDLKSWYEKIGVLLQDFNRYEHTIKENIYFGHVNEKANLKKIILASVSAGSHEFIKKYEKGYEQMLGKMFEGGVELSVGQWQKLALARAFFRNAPVLILDEPTASIDAKAEAEIFNKVERFSKNKTVVIISHRFSTVRNADKIYVIDNGKIVESGSHGQLMDLNGQYANMFKLQAKGYQLT